MATTYLTRTFSASPTSTKIITFSAWIKRAGSGEQHIFGNRATDSYRAHIYLMSDDRLCCFSKKTDGTNTTLYDLITTRKFRDLTGYYHIVVAIDTTQAASGDRVKIYVNGVQETAFDLETQPAQDSVLQLNKDLAHEIGSYDGTNYFYNGCMSHIIFIDGTQYAASAFGSTDATTGQWKISTTPSVTYGNHGFFILKDGNSVTDQSGNSNNWTVGAGTLTKTEDSPSNLFCTWNPNQPAGGGVYESTYSYGNTKASGDNANWQRSFGTLAAKTGKWYYEIKAHDVNAYNTRIGWDSIDNINMNGAETYYSGLTIDGEGKMRGGEQGTSAYDPNAVQLTDVSTSSNLSFTSDDWLGMAIDLDNQTFKMYKNGTLVVNDQSYSSYSGCSILKSKGWMIGPSVNWFSTSGDANRTSANFGNGAMDSTQFTGTTYNDSQGSGVFKYDPPSGYLAWCTRNLNNN